MTSFTREFKVRHYECDAYGHVNNANYLRYMEQAAIEASAAVGYDDARYAALGTLWLIRETDIEYLLPLKMNDVVAVKTWVADFRRVRSQRRYEFTRVSDGATVARATTDWVYLERATQRPVSVTPDMIAAYCPNGTPEAAQRERIAAAPPVPPRPHSMHRRVEWRDIDMAQHVNNATYLNYMEECGIQSLDSFGWSVDRLTAENIAIVARRHQIEYQQPAMLGDMLRVTTFLADVRRATAVRHFTIVREKDDVILARARSQWVFMNPTTLQPTRVPEAILRDFAAHIASEN